MKFAENAGVMLGSVENIELKKGKIEDDIYSIPLRERQAGGLDGYSCPPC
jgi:hypothetical protein